MKVYIIFPSIIVDYGSLSALHKVTEKLEIVAHVNYDEVIPNCSLESKRSPDARIYIRSKISDKDREKIKNIIAGKLEISVDDIKEVRYDRPAIWKAYAMPEIKPILKQFFGFQQPLYVECEIDKCSFQL